MRQIIFWGHTVRISFSLSTSAISLHNGLHALVPKSPLPTDIYTYIIKYLEKRPIIVIVDHHYLGKKQMDYTSNIKIMATTSKKSAPYFWVGIY